LCALGGTRSDSLSKLRGSPVVVMSRCCRRFGLRLVNLQVACCRSHQNMSKTPRSSVPYIYSSSRRSLLEIILRGSTQFPIYVTIESVRAEKTPRKWTCIGRNFFHVLYFCSIHIKYYIIVYITTS